MTDHDDQADREPQTFETDMAVVLDGTTASEIPPARPSNHRVMHRLSLNDQDEWSNRMARRFGGEW